MINFNICKFQYLYISMFIFYTWCLNELRIELRNRKLRNYSCNVLHVSTVLLLRHIYYLWQPLHQPHTRSTLAPLDPHDSPTPALPSRRLQGRQGIVHVVAVPRSTEMNRHRTGRIALWDCTEFYGTPDWTASVPNLLSVEIWQTHGKYGRHMVSTAEVV